jgi:hypothetical protein
LLLVCFPDRVSCFPPPSSASLSHHLPTSTT